MLKAIVNTIFAAIFVTLCGNFAAADRQDQENKTDTHPLFLQSSRNGRGDSVLRTTIYVENGVECGFEIPSYTRGLTTTIAVSIKGDGQGTVSGNAKNSFTLGTSIIPVYIILWSSTTKTGINVNNPPEIFNYISDLNIWKSIECKKSTNGTAKYWQAHAFWNLDRRGWQHGSTPVSYYSADAVYDKNK